MDFWRRVRKDMLCVCARKSKDRDSTYFGRVVAHRSGRDFGGEEDF